MVYGTPKLLAIYNKRYYMSTLRAPYEHSMYTLVARKNNIRRGEDSNNSLARKSIIAIFANTTKIKI